MESSGPTSLAEVRARIDAVDTELVGLLAERESLVRAAAAFKADADAVRAPDRVEQVIAGVRERASAAGLSPTVAEAVWRAMIGAFIDLELGEHTRKKSGLPGADVARVQEWCAGRVPERVRDKVRVECEVASRHLTVLDCHALRPGAPESEWARVPVARFRFTKASATWSLYWCDSDSRFHRYDPVPPTADIGALLGELERDPTALFWG